ncbi:hypothetical protein [Marinobacter goseongensis]|uniref:hypothetical protein n=1 Tax=Marinobacter goseongensis TaxID=453838 RepID=UPI002002D1DF|nr:hypothetical protein [Marinobacter goseongensis]MCK7552071.1 hypothetical protein [Marinobacter goseongensis]
MTKNAYGHAVLALACLGIAPVAQAELEPISEQEMSEVQGQGFMAIENLTDGVHQFTRMSLTMDAETRVNADSMTLGSIDGGADFLAADVALGHIAREDGVQRIDGQTYSAGDTVPFVGLKPYIELAEVDNQLAGFRMGFREARGTFSSDTESFSGNIGLQIEQADGSITPATLFDANSNATNFRASHFGIAGEATDCSVSGGGNCAPLSYLRTLDIGDAPDVEGAPAKFTNDFFLSFQREGVSWQSPEGGNVIEAAKGVFLNLPTSMTLNAETVFQNGIPREQTNYIDRGNGMF